MKFRVAIALLLFSSALYAQEQKQKYFPPEDSLVQKKLQWWSDAKFGLLMHWGTYSQWGIVESWSICPEDEDWCRRKGPYGNDYFQYKQAYEKLITTFNPVKFNPEKWAAAAKDAGMKYVVFTTKHHDGFCMFDTKQTDYKITGADCPFSINPKSNVAKEIFTAFRKEGFGTGAYFSKPDWHSPYYWDPKFPPLDRNVNYDIKKYPEKWNQFKDFTAKQIKELMSDYGPVDILWLDGGWVQPMTETSPRWGRLPVDQDIDMPKIASMARKLQPGLLVVDRAVEGKYQDYLTPEQKIPDEPLPYPWETCMTMATSWSYVPNDKYKSSNELIHTLARIVSRGGNLLLNIAPSPEGEFDDTAYSRLKDISVWMKINGEAIYETQAFAPFQSGKIVFTQKKNGTIYAIYLADERERQLPEQIILHGIHWKVSSAQMLGEKSSLKCKTINNELMILIPENQRAHSPCREAWVFKFEK